MAEAMLSGRKRINPSNPSTVPSITAILPRVDKTELFEIKAEMISSPRYNSKDSGIELDEPQSPKKALYPAEPNLGKILRIFYFFQIIF